jgi:hypothetical protein
MEVAMATKNYCTREELQASMPELTGAQWDTYEAILEALVTRASRAIDTFCNREPGAFFVEDDTTRYFDGSGERTLWTGELAAPPTSLSVAESGDIDDSSGTGGDYTLWAASDYLLWPYNALLEQIPFLRIDVDTLNGTKTGFYRYPKSVKLVGKFGFSATTPAGLKQATLIQASRWFKRGQQAWEDTGAVAELNTLRYVQRMDPDVALMVDSFRKVTI